MENSKLNDNIKYINTDSSPSHLFNNLTVSDKHIFFIHNSETLPRVMAIDKKLLYESHVENLTHYVTKLNSNETNEMLIVKCVNVNNNYFIACGLYGGFKLWSSDGNRLLFQIPTKVKTTSKPYAFTSIAEYKSNAKGNCYDSILCVDNYGQLFIVNGFAQNWRAKLLYSNDGVSSSTVCSGLNTEYICVGYETGEVFIFKMKNDTLVEVAAKLDSLTNLPCFSMTVIEAMHKNILAISYLNGEVKLYDLSSGNFELLSTLGAHLRVINNIISYKNYFITCGDDCFVNIWKVDKDDNISVIGNYELIDKMPVGAAILEGDGKVELLVSSFDHPCLALINIYDV
jgi:hypothetical protein